MWLNLQVTFFYKITWLNLTLNADYSPILYRPTPLSKMINDHSSWIPNFMDCIYKMAKHVVSNYFNEHLIKTIKQEKVPFCKLSKMFVFLNDTKVLTHWAIWTQNNGCYDISTNINYILYISTSASVIFSSIAQAKLVFIVIWIDVYHQRWRRMKYLGVFLVSGLLWPSGPSL